MMGETLPYDAEVEYLEAPYSTPAKCYFRDSDFTLNTATDELYLKIETFSNTFEANCLIGTAKGLNGNYMVCHLYYKLAMFDCNSTSYTCNDNGRTPRQFGIYEYWIKRDFRRIVYNKTQTVVENTTYAPFGVGGPCYEPLTVFWNNSGNRPNYQYPVRIYCAKIWRSGSIVRDFIFTRIGQVGYMYDRANPTGGPLGNGLYPNSGTGSFVLGPDKT